ncbi:MAG: type II toxin-antitoxin system VapC family toxin [Methanocellales archaeon]|nr:type II toxin-antitoxin system VapC family toxin [Methanocellales archaeon]MDI6903256.1 type II toxin-antitoxin system VapC family toxin [Methanocellales archaeon]
MRAYIDTNIFIYPMTKHPTFGLHCKNILADIRDGKLEAVTSVVSLAEVLHVVRGEKDVATAVNAVRGILALPIEFVSVTMSTMLVATDRFKKHNLDSLDAIHLATALQKGVDIFISNDVKLSEIDEITLLAPSDY